MNMTMLREALDMVRGRLSSARPQTAVILGSGWGDVVEGLSPHATLPYADIPHLGPPSVAGHEGNLHVATIAGCEALLFQGRRHWYEGCGWEPIAIPVYLALRLGAKTLLLTNSAGGLRDDHKAGDLMLITDHINAMGHNPLIGPHDPDLGPRFPDQTRVYDPTLGKALLNAARATGVEMKQGVYVSVTGPVYETPAEIRAFRALGADAIGMSTVPEAILGNAAGLHVAAISCITNPAAGLTGAALSHEEVLQASASAQGVVLPLVRAFLESLPSDDPHGHR